MPPTKLVMFGEPDSANTIALANVEHGGRIVLSDFAIEQLRKMSQHPTPGFARQLTDFILDTAKEQAAQREAVSQLHKMFGSQPKPAGPLDVFDLFKSDIKAVVSAAHLFGLPALTLGRLSRTLQQNGMHLSDHIDLETLPMDKIALIKKSLVLKRRVDWLPPQMAEGVREGYCAFRSQGAKNNPSAYVVKAASTGEYFWQAHVHKGTAVKFTFEMQYKLPSDGSSSRATGNVMGPIYDCLAKLWTPFSHLFDDDFKDQHLNKFVCYFTSDENCTPLNEDVLRAHPETIHAKDGYRWTKITADWADDRHHDELRRRCAGAIAEARKANNVVNASSCGYAESYVATLGEDGTIEIPATFLPIVTTPIRLIVRPLHPAWWIAMMIEEGASESAIESAKRLHTCSQMFTLGGKRKSVKRDMVDGDA